MRVLIVEDHPDLAENIGDYLEESGHTADFAFDGPAGLELAMTGEHDVIVLDLMLPGMDGLELCRRLRQEAHHRTPVLMLTARDTLPDKLAGFEAGTDDYLVKPFALKELGARLEALRLRGTQPSRVLAVDDLTFDVGTLEAHRAGRRLNLSGIRLRLLEMLMAASPNVVRTPEIERRLWGDEPPDSNALSAHVYALRRQLDADGRAPLLHTVLGVGYRLARLDETP